LCSGEPCNYQIETTDQLPNPSVPWGDGDSRLHALAKCFLKYMKISYIPKQYLDQVLE